MKRYVPSGLLVLCLLFLVFSSAWGAPTEREEQIRVFAGTLRSSLAKGILPIIDVECHFGNMDVEELIKKMDKSGVALVWLGPNEKSGSAESLRLHKLYPARFVPTTVHGDGKLWHGSDKGFLETLRADARSGLYFAMGEFEARHYESSTNSRNIHMPVDSEAMQVVFQSSSDTGLPFLLHHEAEDALLPELERMLAKYPKAKLIWCHGGRNRNPTTWKKFTSPDGLRDLLTRYPNLYFDIVQSKPGSKYSWTGYLDAVMYGWQRGTGEMIKPEWRTLFQDFPDRFLIGSDVNRGRFRDYEDVMATFRTILFRDLRKETAEKIAYKNAWRLMTGSEWQE